MLYHLLSQLEYFVPDGSNFFNQEPVQKCKHFLREFSSSDLFCIIYIWGKLLKNQVIFWPKFSLFQIFILTF